MSDMRLMSNTLFIGDHVKQVGKLLQLRVVHGRPVGCATWMNKLILMLKPEAERFAEHDRQTVEDSTTILGIFESKAI